MIEAFTVCSDILESRKQGRFISRKVVGDAYLRNRTLCCYALRLLFAGSKVPTRRYSSRPACLTHIQCPDRVLHKSATASIRILTVLSKQNTHPTTENICDGHVLSTELQTYMKMRSTTILSFNNSSGVSFSSLSFSYFVHLHGHSRQKHAICSICSIHLIYLSARCPIGCPANAV